MNTKPSQVFSEWIETVVADPSSGECLPTIKELARRFGLSATSIKNLLKPYVASGTLTSIRGRGTFVTSRMSRSAKPASLRTVRSADSIADALAGDIATGKLKHGDPLPAVKLMCRQFKAGQATVTRAYRLLEQRGLARRVGRNFWVGGLQSIRSLGAWKSLACFNYSEGDASDLKAGNDVREAFKAMEYELHNHRLELRFEDSAQLDLFLHPPVFSRSDCAGVVITGVRVARFDYLQPRIQALEPALKAGGKRILVCGNHATQRIPRNTSYFCHGTIITNTVRTAADYCSTRGFRDIVPVFREGQDNLKDLRFLLRFISESLTRNPKVRILFLIQSRRANQSPEDVFRRTPSYVRHQHFDYLEGLLSKYETMTMDDLYTMVRVGTRIDDLFAHAPQGALWVTRDASTALRVVDWCEARRLPVPSSAAVLSFDEDPLLQYRGIAACVPDWHTMGYLMAHSLIGDIPIKKSRKGFLRTPAVLYRRSTLP